MAETNLPINLEMAATEEMLAIAVAHKPASACIVPEKRQELTTEGGLDVMGSYDALKPYVDKLRAEGISVSLFIDPDLEQIKASKKLARIK
jgi:pyridoxine 5-phosphate synthase